MKEGFETSLLRMIAANSCALLLLQISHDLFGKPYFSLGVEEKKAVDSQLERMSAHMFGWIAPGLFPEEGSRSGMGFQPPPASGSADK